MKKVAVILAEGFEEIEAISVIDILRRAEINVTTIGLESAFVTGSNGVIVKSNLMFNEVDYDTFDMIVLPGGMPGAVNLASSRELLGVLADADKKGKLLAAICAAPMVLARAGVLKDEYVCYPGFEKNVRENGYVADKNVLKDKNIITGKGPALAMEFALFLVRELCGDEVYKSVKSGLLFN